MRTNRYPTKVMAESISALIGSAALLFLGTGPHPVCWLTWVAPLPVLLISYRVSVSSAFAIAMASWFVGSLNLWDHFHHALEFSLAKTLIIIFIPSCVFGTAVVTYRFLMRRGALWQAVLAVPAVWVLYEYLISVADTQRMFSNIAYTQMGCILTMRLASALSIWGLSFCLFLFPSAAAALLSKQGDKVRLLKSLVVVGCVFLAAIAAHLVWRSRTTASAKGPELQYYRQIFDRTVVMIPMRDGIRLYTEIYKPKQGGQSLPFLIERTNYTLDSDATHYTPNLADFSDMFADRYIFVFQEIRGRYSSEGQFVMFRTPRNPTIPNATDEASDAYDTIDWLIRNIPNNNGRVGLVGASYSGWLSTMALLDPHPALRAISEQASPADQFLGDDFHRNGAFRLSYGFEYSVGLEASRKSFSFPADMRDMYSWYLALGSLSSINALYAHYRMPTWNDFIEHPNYDQFWKARSFHQYLSDKKLAIPLLNVAGWWDPENLYGPLKIYEDLLAHDSDRRDYLVIGPWNHVGWNKTVGTGLGPLDFGSDTGAFFRESIEAPWFAYWLHDKGTLPLAHVTVFETGPNKWRSYEQWPPSTGTTQRKLYFRGHGELSFDPPSEGGDACDSYISDPAKPVPYRRRPIEETYATGSHWATWLLEDQSFVEGRPDTLTWATPPLTENLLLSGDTVAHLFASTTGTDSDWVVKLIDVYPGNYPGNPKLSHFELIISDEVLRGRFRESFERPAAITPDQVTQYTVDLHTNNHVFLEGHRIMVQVQSTWFPLIDRNPQQFVPNIFLAAPADYQKTVQKIYRSDQYPSSIDISVGTP